MSFNIQLKQTLQDKLNELIKLESLETQTYLDKFLNSHHRSNVHQLSPHNLITEEQTIISNSGLVFQSSEVQKLNRILLHGTVFHSLLPINAEFSQDNTFCCYQITGEIVWSVISVKISGFYSQQIFTGHDLYNVVSSLLVL